LRAVKLSDTKDWYEC